MLKIQKILTTKPIKWLLIFITVNSLMACSLYKAKQQSEILEGASPLSGCVDLQNIEGKGYVNIFKKDNDRLQFVGKTELNGEGCYTLHLLPDDYVLFVFVDENKNRSFDKGEVAAFYTDEKGQINSYTVAKDTPKKLKLFHLENQTINFNILETKTSRTRLTKNIGLLTSIDDARFSKKNNLLGFWNPIDFVEKVEGGLLMLSPYDKTKIPVLFVHGILADPTSFKVMIEQIDQDKYQPWVLYYPSGLPLNLVSDYMLRGLNQLEAQYQFDELVLVAHSMGGLVARSFLMKYEKSHKNYNVKQFITINTPFYGLDSAAIGIETSPLVIQSWRDVASNSEFIKNLHDWRLPKSIPYHLVFSYLPDEEGDGVVPLTSQLSLSLQEEAVNIHGFEAGHADILMNDDFLKVFQTILSSDDFN